ncbi:hypothetical protein SBD_6961 [Streptomyces bottropensis ATCC 25435]|uniref:Uncharacterized protein n=1 Tax=Streptomyces bottropensis ATCC 25435 TaxID=1054862 RepID=M3FEJ8_9ACTN|nr:hypothetical protein SBD_6961 [Streptomyces bottropensis ATCC 25435]
MEPSCDMWHTPRPEPSTGPPRLLHHSSVAPLRLAAAVHPGPPRGDVPTGSRLRR